MPLTYTNYNAKYLMIIDTVLRPLLHCLMIKIPLYDNIMVLLMSKELDQSVYNNRNVLLTGKKGIFYILVEIWR